MCLEDIRLQRKSISGQTIRSVGTSATMLIGPSELRTALIISCPASGILTISLTPDVTNNNGIILNALGTPFKLDLMNDGAIVKSGIWAIHSATTVTIGIWETSLEEK